MQLTTAFTALLAASAGVADAYQVRIGYKRTSSNLGPNTFCKPFFKVWDDNWSYVTEKEFTNSGFYCVSDNFCGVNPCPFQVDGLTIGIRVHENGGSDGALRVEAWRGSKSVWTWCKSINLTEGNGVTWFRWQCDFGGL
ncbi:hypothetical protein B0T25DRAFT_545931 [Lasiosphaeria hispida]|uniref:Uncharacterized protein n=1 Tax=Lasiosphaeria hispida TaxID=260671 RepID=A0AAJ0HJW9_9PEZI|nr:hypothetical protein B0T25DRAFT_545931 [Lasiosphaeria hispida]